jgi:hypothetical protein
LTKTGPHFLTPSWASADPHHPYNLPTHISKQIPHPACFNPEDGNSMFLKIVYIYLQGYAMLQPIRAQSEKREANIEHIS